MSYKLLRARLDVIYLYLSYKQKDQMYPIGKQLSLSLRYFFFFFPCTDESMWKDFQICSLQCQDFFFLRSYDHDRWVSLCLLDHLLNSWNSVTLKNAGGFDIHRF